MPWQYRDPQSLDAPKERFARWRAAIDARKEMLTNCGWRQLTPSEDSELETQLRTRFPLNAQSRPAEPHIAWDVIEIYSDASRFDELEADLLLMALHAIRRCTVPGEQIFAVDWQHAWYSFDPHAFPSTGDSYKWAVPVLPDGDYYFFFPKDFRFGIYGFPHTTVCVCGQQLLDSFELHRPIVFSKRVEASLHLAAPKTERCKHEI